MGGSHDVHKAYVLGSNNRHRKTFMDVEYIKPYLAYKFFHRGVFVYHFYRNDGHAYYHYEVPLKGYRQRAVFDVRQLPGYQNTRPHTNVIREAIDDGSLLALLSRRLKAEVEFPSPLLPPLETEMYTYKIHTPEGRVLYVEGINPSDALYWATGVEPDCLEGTLNENDYVIEAI